ncbi:hypothetical protein SSCG_04414 [Streptomyces clavuligerus]|nr:hypothetical protein SSCG_04414 [Streptomyces clavuligerus]
MLHHIRQQRHGRIGASWRKASGPNGGLLRHAAHRRTSRPLPPNGPTGVPEATVPKASGTPAVPLATP